MFYSETNVVSLPVIDSHNNKTFKMDKEKILALLVEKFPGVRKDALTVLARTIALQCADEKDAATIVNDTMEELIEQMDDSENMQRLGGTLGTLDQAEKHQMIRELISPHLNTMFVTPKDIDETVKYLSYTISEGLNLAFSQKQE